MLELLGQPDAAAAWRVRWEAAAAGPAAMDEEDSQLEASLDDRWAEGIFAPSELRRARAGRRPIALSSDEDDYEEEQIGGGSVAMRETS